MPLPAWIITPSSPVMCCGWYIGPHLLLLCFHLARSSKSSINKKKQKSPGLQQDFCTAKDYRLRSTVKTAWPIWSKLESWTAPILPITQHDIEFPLVLIVSLINSSGPLALLILVHIHMSLLVILYDFCRLSREQATVQSRLIQALASRRICTTCWLRLKISPAG